MTKLVQAPTRVRWPLAAVALHALALGLLWMVTAPAGPLPMASHVAIPAEITLDGTVDTSEGATPPATPEPGVEAPAGGPVAARGAVTIERARIEPPPAEPEPTSSERSAPPATTAGPPGERAPADEGAPIQLTRRGPEDLGLGLGGPNRFVPTSAAAVEQAEARRAVQSAVRDPARERERELGLGPEGPVLTALGEGTARSTAPVRGRAVFVATVSAAGEVVSLEVTETEGSRAGWADAGQIALAALRSKRLTLPPSTTRAVMRIEVKSAWKLPSGQDPGTDVTLFHIPIAKGEGKESAKMTFLDPIPKIHVDYLEVGGPGGAKIPLPSIELNLFDTNADPTNLGASARRVIHTRSLDTQLM